MIPIGFVPPTISVPSVASYSPHISLHPPNWSPLSPPHSTRSSFLPSTRSIFHPHNNTIKPSTITKANSKRETTKMAAQLESNVRNALVKLFEETPCMPIMVRLAWHDAGTYDCKGKTGGPNASIRFKPESAHGANNGLDIARRLLQPVKDQFPEISYADLYQLSSVVGIEFSGGPKIPFRMGRKDVSESETTPDGRLPAHNQGMGHLRDIFYRMGLDDKDITVLSGAHTLGMAHPDRSGEDGKWTHEYLKFDNSYYVEILKDNPDPKLLRLGSDLDLLGQPDTKALCEKYAKDQQAFFNDYVESHVKLSELGCFA